ncbi:MAG: hypothetical protein GXP45_04645 [bacterium]|nr:hypothetical protein [bacterium]
MNKIITKYSRLDVHFRSFAMQKIYEISEIHCVFQVDWEKKVLVLDSKKI